MFTYDTLKKAIIEYTENDNEPTFEGQIPTFVRLAEERILKAAQLQVFVNTSYKKASARVHTVAKPANWLATQVISLRNRVPQIVVPSVPTRLTPLPVENVIYLENKDISYIQSYWPDETQVGVPKYYADFSEQIIMIAPTPARDYVVDFRYLYRPQSLADHFQAPPAPDTTWLSKNAPQALLYACLIEAYTFMKGQLDMVELYNSRFNESIIRLKNLGEGLEPDDALKKSIIRNPPS